MATKQTQDIDLGIVRYEHGDSTRPQRAVLTIETDKAYNGGIESDAKVMWHGDRVRVRSHMFGIGKKGGDFSKTILRSDKTVRATQSAINRQHGCVFSRPVVDQLTADAKAHYAGVVDAGEDGFHNTYPKFEEVPHA